MYSVSLLQLSESDALAADHSVERMSEHAHILETPVNGQQIRASEREMENFEARVEVELERSAHRRKECGVGAGCFADQINFIAQTVDGINNKIVFVKLEEV